MHFNLFQKLLLDSRFYECHAMSSFIFAEKIAIQVYLLFCPLIFYCLNRLQKRQPRYCHRRRLKGHPLLITHKQLSFYYLRLLYCPNQIWLFLLCQHQVLSSKAVRSCALCKQDERSRRLIFTTLVH